MRVKGPSILQRVRELMEEREDMEWADIGEWWRMKRSFS